MSLNEYQDLLEFLGHRFEVIDRRFGAIDQQFVGIFRRFDAVDRRFEVMQGQIDGNHREALGHFGEIYRRIDRLDQEYVAVTEALRRLER
jgi:hypothetical protein